jgi:hypothetical protein
VKRTQQLLRSKLLCMGDPEKNDQCFLTKREAVQRPVSIVSGPI